MQRWMLVIVLGLAACSAGMPPLDYTAGQTLYSADFADGETTPWDADGQRTGNEFRLRGATQNYTWTVDERDIADVQLEVVTRLVTDTPNNGYGAGCRMDADGSGYYFLISRDGYHAILSGTAQSIVNLTAWEASEFINTGQGAQNTVRAACIGDDLALFVNGAQVARTTDDAHTSGNTGLIVSGGAEGASTVAFEQVQAVAIR